MNQRPFLLGGAAIVVLGAAFLAGHYTSTPTPPPPAQTQPLAQAPAAPAAPVPAPQAETQPPAVAPATPPATKPKPPAADYASGEDRYAAPPPPPPPREEVRDHPNPFHAPFNTFPMRHSGQGTLASPLTWSAQTALGNGREADLRISILVPEPPANDRGQFWRRWGGHNQTDLIPGITRGTPVIVAGSASVVVAVDPEILDLEAPATLTVSGRDGQRIYRSRDVAPARGEAWDSRGARWIFAPDAEFYDLMRDGADVSISVRDRIDGRMIRIPFDTSDFSHTARRFERSLSQRIDVIAAEWEQVRPGRPTPPHGGPPVVVATPAGPSGSPPHAQPGNNAPPGPDHGKNHDHGRSAGNDGSKQQPPAPQTTLPAAPPKTADNSARGHARDHGKTKEGTPVTRTADNTQKPTPPVIARPPAVALPTRPAHPVAVQDPRAAMRTAMVSAYRPPTDNCGAEPALSIGATLTPADRAAFNQKKRWMGCRTKWINQYEKTVTALGKRVADPGEKPMDALKAVKGGAGVIGDYQKARAEFTAQSNAWLPQLTAFLRANGNLKGGKP